MINTEYRKQESKLEQQSWSMTVVRNYPWEQVLDTAKQKDSRLPPKCQNKAGSDQGEVHSGDWLRTATNPLINNSSRCSKIQSFKDIKRWRRWKMKMSFKDIKRLRQTKCYQKPLEVVIIRIRKNRINEDLCWIKVTKCPASKHERLVFTTYWNQLWRYKDNIQLWCVSEDT